MAIEFVFFSKKSNSHLIRTIFRKLYSPYVELSTIISRTSCKRHKFGQLQKNGFPCRKTDWDAGKLEVCYEYGSGFLNQSLTNTSELSNFFSRILLEPTNQELRKVKAINIKTEKENKTGVTTQVMKNIFCFTTDNNNFSII